MYSESNETFYYSVPYVIIDNNIFLATNGKGGTLHGENAMG